MKKYISVCFLFYFFILFLNSCSNSSSQEKEKTKSTYSNPSNSTINSDEEDIESNNGSSNSRTNSGENVDEENKNISSNNSGCKLSDGTYSATVNYNNPETGYSNTYTLQVDVEDCQVVKIYFPKGGWLDDDHITAADIDEDGNANVEGEESKTYEVQIDN